jgi:NAD+ kinase
MIRTIGVIANCQKPRAADTMRRLAAKCRRLGLDLVADESTAALLDGDGDVDGNLSARLDLIDVLIAMGGDGTVLRAVRELKGHDKPVIGVNLGSLGYLTSVTETDLERAVDCFIRGDFTHTERAIADCSVIRQGETIASLRALNDVVINSLSVRVIRLLLAVNAEEVSSIVCDGLIVSTPTGSTGHSLSAGGPLLMPDTRALAVTMICPHTLSTRPLVVPEGSVIRVTIESQVDVMLTADGQLGQPLAVGDQIHVRRAAQGVRFVHLPGYSYFAVLRQKLHWRGANV